MGGRGGGAPAGRTAVPSGFTSGNSAAEQALIDVFWTQVRARGSNEQTEYVRLSDIRPGMEARGFDRAQQDAAFLSFMTRADRRKVGSLTTIANLKSLSPADRAAAVNLGGEDQTAVYMYRPSR